MVLRGLALGLGFAALWFAYQLGMEFFIAWYSGTEQENGAPPWPMLVLEVAAFALAGLAAVVFALWPRRDGGSDDVGSS